MAPFDIPLPATMSRMVVASYPFCAKRRRAAAHIDSRARSDFSAWFTAPPKTNRRSVFNVPHAPGNGNGKRGGAYRRGTAGLVGGPASRAPARWAGRGAPGP